MGIVNEEVQHEEFPMTLEIVERVAGEVREPWRFIDIKWDSFERLTPPELRQIGWWLVREGQRIGSEYKSNGAKKT